MVSRSEIELSGTHDGVPPSHIPPSISLLQAKRGLDFYELNYFKKNHTIIKQSNGKEPLSSIYFKG